MATGGDVPRLSQWEAMTPLGRRTTIVAVVEGLMLASAAPGGEGIDAACVGKATFDRIDSGLVAAARKGDGDLVQALVEASGCKA